MAEMQLGLYDGSQVLALTFGEITSITFFTEAYVISNLVRRKSSLR
jgi:hypothetical protein